MSWFVVSSRFSRKTIGLISVDPSKRKTGGALLGDRIRMNAINSPRVFMRSLATRQSNLALSKYVADAIQVIKAAKYDIIILNFRYWSIRYGDNGPFRCIIICNDT
jgi:putative protein kinase ArgK-like GTPase of G3E family